MAATPGGHTQSYTRVNGTRALFLMRGDEHDNMTAQLLVTERLPTPACTGFTPLTNRWKSSPLEGGACGARHRKSLLPLSCLVARGAFPRWAE